MAFAYFSRLGFLVKTTDLYFEPATMSAWQDFIKLYPQAAIINCLGAVPQKSGEANKLFWGNSIFALFLLNSLSPDNILIHPSTDCVFRGDKAPYASKEETDFYDYYSLSKGLAEKALVDRSNIQVIRTSIIGEDKSANAAGLLAWFLSHKDGDTVDGYVNHFWNGITTLEWCRQIHLLLNGWSYVPHSVLQLGTEEVYSKYEMLCLFNELYRRRIIIKKTNAAKSVNRQLIPDIICPNLRRQLIEMIAFGL